MTNTSTPSSGASAKKARRAQGYLEWLRMLQSAPMPGITPALQQALHNQTCAQLGARWHDAINAQRIAPADPHVHAAITARPPRRSLPPI